VLADGECAIWWATPRSYRPALDGLLEEAERRRADVFRRPEDRVRSILGAVVLRLAAAGETGIGPGEVTVRRDCPHCGAPHGRPTLPGTGLHVSISHSGERVAVAMTRLAPVGVDVEEALPVDTAGLARSVLGTAPAEDVAGLYVVWCRKEAVVKATGDGLRVSLPDVRVSRSTEPARLVSYPGRPDLEATLTDLRPGAGYAGALAVLHRHAPILREHDASTLLDRA
jgi:4'-phosphopantetheinyl transferase